MKKSLVLAMAMALGVTASAYAANPFSDVPAGHWAYDSVAKLADAGVVDGYGAEFGGDKLMTRYEMAQITAKAMAKGQNVDKLAAEFADELDTLGVRVANLEKKADAVKITGQARLSYGDYEGQGVAALRTRLWVTGEVNEDWTYTAMLQNTQTITGEDSNKKNNVGGDDDVVLNRAYLNGKIGGMDVLAGRWDECTFTANVLDVYLDGAKLSYGDDVKVFGIVGKGTNEGGNAEFSDTNGRSEDRVYVVGVEGKVLGANAYAGYFKAETETEQEIWNVGFNTEVGKDLVLAAEYMVGDEVYAGLDDDGWYADLAWKGADAATEGSYGVHVSYYDQSANAYLSPTTDGYNSGFDKEGYKGFAYGASYTFAKNIVGVVNYYDFETKVSGENNRTLFSEVYFHF